MKNAPLNTPWHIKSEDHSRSMFSHISNTVTSVFPGRRRSSSLSTDSTDSTTGYSMVGSLKGLLLRRFSRSIEAEETEAGRKNSLSTMAEKDINLEEFYPYDLRGQFPDSFVRKAERELGETPDVREKALSQLKELIHKSEREFRTDEFFLLAFLRVKKFEAKRAFHLMQNFYNYKEKHHDLNLFDKDLVVQQKKKRIITIFPYRDSLGRVVYSTRIGLCNPDLMSANQMICALAVVVSAALLNEPVNQVSGAVVILDFANVSIKWLAHFTYGNAKLFLFIFLNALPIRYQAVHIVNQNFLFKPVYTMIQKLSTNKMKERFFFHGRNMKSLHKHIPTTLLPPEYGGTLKAAEIELGEETILDNRFFS